MKLLLIYPSGNEVIEEVQDEHAERWLGFGGEAFALAEDGSRRPLADVVAELPPPAASDAADDGP